jgi:hypothetical protein
LNEQQSIFKIIHFLCSKNYSIIFRHPPRLQEIIEATQANSYHGFLPALVRQCIDKLTGKIN